MMSSSPHTFRASCWHARPATLPLRGRARPEPIRIVFQNGRSVPVSARGAARRQARRQDRRGGIHRQGQTFPLESADHVYGDKPAELNPAIALLLTGKPAEALKLLEPVVAAAPDHRENPGKLLAGSRPRRAWSPTPSTATPPSAPTSARKSPTPPRLRASIRLSHSARPCCCPSSTKVEDRAIALEDLTTDNLPADVCAYASFFRGNCSRTPNGADPTTPQTGQKPSRPISMVPCLFPSGGMILNAVAELERRRIPHRARSPRRSRRPSQFRGPRTPPAPWSAWKPTSALKA